MFFSPNKVHGCTLDIQDIHSRILFPTVSDALVASLIVKYANVTLELFDDLLALFRHPEFNIANISMAKAVNFMDLIAEQRRGIAKKRETLAMQAERGFREVSPLVVELIVEQLHTQKDSFHHAIKYGLVCEAEGLLHNMSLVHRSWTGIAQRCLRRRIRAKGPHELRSVLQSPRLGPWVRELDTSTYPVYSTPSLSCGSLEAFDPTNAHRLQCEIIKRCPNVKELYLEGSYGADPSSDPADAQRQLSPDIFQCLYDLQDLESLWVRQHHDGGYDGLVVKKLCTVLPYLRSLKNLSLRSWFTHVTIGTAFTNAVIDEGHPSRHGSLMLDSLSLVYVTHPGLLSWLAKSCRDCPPTGMELSLRDICRTAGDLSVLKDSFVLLAPITPFVKRLMLHDYEYGDNMPTVLAQFPSLHSLCLCFYSYMFFPEDSFVLPSSIQIVQFHYTSPPGEDQERPVLFTLQVSPHIRRLLITYSQNSLGEEDDPDPDVEVFKATGDYCIENEVEFIVERVDVVPSILDI